MFQLCVTISFPDMYRHSDTGGCSLLHCGRRHPSPPGDTQPASVGCPRRYHSDLPHGVAGEIKVWQADKDSENEA